MKKRIISLLTACWLTSFSVLSTTAVSQEEQYKYTVKDLINLQDFLLARSAAEDLKDKPYDLDNDGVWSVFDLTLMRRAVAENMESSTVYVSDTAELKAALLNAEAGDTILLAPGVYESSDYGKKAALFYSESEGTENAHIIIKSADPDDPAVLKGTDTARGIVLYITGDYWDIEDIVCCNAQKGIMLDNSKYSLIKNVEVYDTGQEGIHLRDGSSYCEVVGAKVHDTGLAGSYGEAVYIGSAKSTSGYVHECDYNVVRDCVLGPNVTDESVDIKEYTTGNIIENSSTAQRKRLRKDAFLMNNVLLIVLHRRIFICVNSSN